MYTPVSRAYVVLFLNRKTKLGRGKAYKCTVDAGESRLEIVGKESIHLVSTYFLLDCLFGMGERITYNDAGCVCGKVVNAKSA